MINKLVNISTSLRFKIDKILYYIDKKNIDKLYKLKNIYKDKPLVIVGNGPSLNNTPLDQIKYPCIGMNKIDLIFKKTNWRPWCIIVVNGLVIRQNSNFFNSTNIKLFIPTKGKYLGIKKRKNVNYINETRKREFIKNITRGFGAGYTVTYSAMQLAYHLGANPVYLIGVDHNFQHKGNANDIKTYEGEDVNHFDPNYFKNQLWGIPDLDSSEKAYKLADECFKADGRTIYDATLGGKLDIFEKVDIQEILK